MNRWKMSLSDKRIEADNEEMDNGFYWEDDVKEFIILVNNDIKKKHNWGVNHGNPKGLIPISLVEKIIKENAGSKLI